MKPHAKSAAHVVPILEAFEPRLLLTVAYDLAITIDALPYASTLPGDEVAIPITVTNVGTETVSGLLHGEIWASDDLVVGDDNFVDEADEYANLAPLESANYTFYAQIPPWAPSGTYYWLAKMSVVSGFTDGNSANDQDFSDALINYWRFGTFDTPDGTRTNPKLTVENDAGQIVSFLLTNGGWGEVDNDTFDTIALTDTTDKSVFQIKGPSSEFVSVGDIDIAGPLKNLNAKTTDLRGSLTAEGVVNSLTLRNVDVGHVIDINTDGPVPTDPKVQCTITLGRVAGTALDTHGVPIKSLTVLEWNDGAVTAPWIGKLTAKGDAKNGIDGNFSADLTLDGSGDPKLTLGSAKIAGELQNATWDITGDVGAIEAKVGISWTQVDIHSSLKSVKTYWYEDSEFTVDGAIGSFTVTEDWDDSDLTADSLKTLKADYFGRGRLTLNGHYVPTDKPVVLGSAKIGYIYDSAADPDDRGWKLYGDVGSIAVGDVTDWFLHIENTNPVKSVKMGQAVNATIEVDNLLGSVSALDWNGGALSAGGIKSVKVSGSKPLALAGSLTGVDLTLTGSGLALGQQALGALSVAGSIDHVNALIAGDVGTIAAGRLYKSSILIGCDDITDDASDFDDGSGGTNQFTLGSLTTKGLVPTGETEMFYFDSSELGVWALTAWKFGAKPGSLDGTVELNSWDAVKLSNPPDSWAGVTIYEVS